eukprot:COSAG02_NODE_1701_length_11248_cov_8.135348_3_plen_202_part_00
MENRPWVHVAGALGRVRGESRVCAACTVARRGGRRTQAWDFVEQYASGYYITSCDTARAPQHTTAGVAEVVETEVLRSCSPSPCCCWPSPRQTGCICSSLLQHTPRPQPIGTYVHGCLQLQQHHRAGHPLQLPEAAVLVGDGGTVLLYFDLHFAKDGDPSSCMDCLPTLRVHATFHADCAAERHATILCGVDARRSARAVR